MSAPCICCMRAGVTGGAIMLFRKKRKPGSIRTNGEYKEIDMALVGIVVTFLGFVITLLTSLAMMSSVNGRMVMVLVGLAVSLIGIIGLLNPAYMKNANWRK